MSPAQDTTSARPRRRLSLRARLSLGSEIRFLFVVPSLAALLFTMALWHIVETRISQGIWSRLENLALLEARALEGQRGPYALPLLPALDPVLTVVDAQGKTLASTSDIIDAPADVLNSLDVRVARTGGSGRASRFARQVDHNALCYTRALAPRGNRSAFLRVLTSTAPLQESLDEMRTNLVVGLGLSLLLGALLVEAMARSISQPLVQLRGALQKPAEMRQLEIDGGLEVRELSAALRTMQSEIQTRNAALDTQNKRLELVLSKLEDGILVFDPAGEVVYANPAAHRILDVSPSALLERSFNDPNDPLSTLVSTSTSPEPQTFHLTLDDRDRHILVDTVQIAWGLGGLSARVSFLRDISSFVRLDRMRQDFVANASHELRTPITAVSTALEALEMGADEDPTHRSMFLARARRAVERLKRLANSLLALSVAEAPQVGLHLVGSDACSEALQVVATQMAAAAARRQELRVHVGAADAYVPMTSVDLQRVLSNLVENAIKYTPEGGCIEVSLQRTEQDVEICVTDNGPGIPAAHLGMVFERFYRANPTGQDGGAGLGLTIARHLVQRAGGSIRAANMPSGGARLTLLLPLKTSPPSEPGGSAASAISLDPSNADGLLRES